MPSRTSKAFQLALSTGIQTLLTLGVAVAMSRILSKEDYATFRQTLLPFQLLEPFLGLGLGAAVLYFVPRAPKEARGILAEMLGAVLAVSALFAGFMLLWGADFFAGTFQNERLASSLRAFSLYPILSLPIPIIVHLLVTQEKMRWIMAYSASRAVVIFSAILVAVLVFGNRYDVAIWGMLAGTGLALLPGLVLFAKAVPPGSWRPRPSRLAGILKYSVPLCIGASLESINRSIGRLVVAANVEPATFAVFINGAMEIPAITIISGVAAKVILPDIAKLHQEGRHTEALELFRRTGVKCALVLFPIGGILFCLAPEVMAVLYGEQYRGGSSFFRIYLLLIPIRAIMYDVLFQGAGRSDLVMLRAAIACVVNLCVVTLFVALFGPIGAPIGMVATMFLFVLPYCLNRCARLFGAGIAGVVDYLTLSKIALSVVLAVAATIGIANLFEVHMLIRILLISCIYTLATLGTFFVFRLPLPRPSLTRG